MKRSICFKKGWTKLTVTELQQKIDEADMIVVGIGAELRVDKILSYDADEIKEFYQKIGMKKYEEVLAKAENSEEFAYLKELYYSYYIQMNNIPTIYDKVAKLLENKNYFIITSNTDDCIYSSQLDHAKIVAPCGTRRNLQCSKGCSKTLYPSQGLLLAKLQEFEQTGETSKIRCGKCKEELEFNVRTKETASRYVEEGYLTQWGAYTKWLQGTLNKQFLVLELGEGFEQPTLFHWPFERLVYFNQKAQLIRVHKTLSQVGEEIKERSQPIPMSAIEFLETYC